MTELGGVIVPIVTPFADDGEIDWQALGELIERLIAGGVHGILPAGSTGEAMTLSPAEYHDLTARTVEIVGGRVPVVVGCSANATRDVIANVKHAVEIEADAVMVTHPYYSRPDDDELLAHYEAVSTALQLPMIVYNNPYTTGVDASADLLRVITRLPNIDYVKESSGDVARVARLVGGDPSVKVFCGTDNLALESFADGAIGWVAGAANGIPQECVRLYELATTTGGMEEARRLYASIYGLLDLAESSGKFVQVNKTAVELLGGRAGSPRLPLLALDSDWTERVRSTLVHARVPMA